MIAKEDALALNALTLNTFALNTRWRYLNEEQKLEQFRLWLQNELNVTQLRGGKQWLDKYILESYRKGRENAYADINKPYLSKKPDFYMGSKEEFLRSSFDRPVATERVKLLIARSYTELDGITDAASQAITRELADGMIRGISPKQVAKNIVEKVDTIGINRARMLARTETIRAHSEGQLDSFEQLGIEKIGIKVEFETSGLGTTKKGNLSPCPKCAAHQNQIYTIAQARGIIPVHPGCLCAWGTIGPRPQTPKQRATRARLAKAIKGSQRPVGARQAKGASSRARGRR